MLWRNFSMVLLLAASASMLAGQSELKIGLIGIDSSHSGRFAQAFNDPAAPGRVAGARIVCGFKGGSPDMERSRSRVEAFSAELRDKYGVVLVDSIAEVVARSDAIMILSVDGRAHLPQAKAVFGSGKPVFIDKPLGGSLAEAIQIVRLAQETRTPLLSCSNYRFAAELAKIKAASPGRVRGAISYGPATLEPLMPICISTASIPPRRCTRSSVAAANRSRVSTPPIPTSSRESGAVRAPVCSMASGTGACRTASSFLVPTTRWPRLWRTLFPRCPSSSCVFSAPARRR